MAETKPSTWITSSHSAREDCVEVCIAPDVVQVRNSNSKRPDGPVVAFTWPEWAAFLAGVRDGEFNLPDARLTT